MKEYTVLAIIAVVVAVILDRISGINVLRRKRFYFFLAVILFFKLLVNGYLTAGAIVMYRPGFFLGKRLLSIPLEDFLFAFSMVTSGIVFWEYFKRREA